MGMVKSKFNIMWVGYCEPMNKVWGWFSHTDSESNQKYYCFWSHMKKTICFKSYNRFSNKTMFNGIRDIKVKNGYTEVKINELVLLWPEFFNDLESNFLSDKLKEKI
jgi:hypothetical protein